MRAALDTAQRSIPRLAIIVTVIHQYDRLGVEPDEGGKRQAVLGPVFLILRGDRT